MNKRRSCPVCLEYEPELLYHQTFAKLSTDSLMDGFDLVACKKCGMLYADRIPSQDAFDEYYDKMSKYVHGGEVYPWDQEHYANIVDFLSSKCHRNDSILDVGCATGGLLSEFKKRGFTDLTGTEPSSACVKIAKEKGLTVYHQTLNDWAGDQKFDLILLIGVLEHVVDLEDLMSTISLHLKPGGKILIEVPDVIEYASYPSAPYQFFSMEHINYFDSTSLTNLFQRFGFQRREILKSERKLSSTISEPILLALFEKTNYNRDKFAQKEVQAYIQKSAKEDDFIKGMMLGIAASQNPILVWGVGTHTLRLLKTSALADCNILGFIDNDTNYQGKELEGNPVYSPLHISEAAPMLTNVPILISSHVSQKEIIEEIKRRGWPNHLITLY